ncbi:MAG: hypothetical protein ABDH28_07220 [Brevinematia bacterium]
MLILPIGLIGVYTSFSRESVLDLTSIQKIAIDNGFKAIGISDPNYPFWIEEIFSLPKTSVIFFPAIRTPITINNQKFVTYIVPNSFQALENLGRRESPNIRELKHLDIIIFYCGKSKEAFSYLYNIFLGKLGIGISKNNKNLIRDVISKVDYIIPFHYSTISQELEKYSSLLKEFIPTPSPLPTTSYIIKELEDLPEQAINKIKHTLEKINDVRDYEIQSSSREETFSSLLWNKILSSTKVDDRIRREFFKIKELGLCEFFYKLIVSFEEFLKHGTVISDILSTSFIFEKLKLIKINKSKVISLSHLLNEKPFYIDIDVSSKEKFTEVLASNFGDELFYRAYPVHIRENFVDEKIHALPERSKELVRSYLKNIVTTFRVSNRLFYSPEYLRKRVKHKNNIGVEFCKKTYDAVLDIRHIEYLPTKAFHFKVLDIIRNDEGFMPPYVLSAFWKDIRSKHTIKGIKDTLSLFYIAKTLSLKPYYKGLMEEIVSQKYPLFVEDILEMLDEKTVEILLSIVWSRDKKDTGINEVDLFRTLVENGMDKETSSKITRLVVRYKNILGIKSIEVPKFYRFLAYAGLKAEDETKFILSVLKNTVVKERKYSFIVLQELINRGYSIRGIDINKASFSKVYEENGNFFLPFACLKVSTKVVEKIIREREESYFKSFSEFYARVGKEFPRDVSKLVKAGAFDTMDNRETLLKIPQSLPKIQRRLALAREEFKTLGFSLLLFSSNFDEIRMKNSCGNIREAIRGKTNKIFGFIARVDRYGNIFLQDEKDTIFVKNKIFLNLRIGNYGIFELDSTSGIFGRNFFLKNIFTEI